MRKLEVRLDWGDEQRVVGLLAEHDRVLAHNRDDHVRNVSYLMDRRGEWRLAPAYDLVFSEGPRGQHMMAVALCRRDGGIDGDPQADRLASLPRVEPAIGPPLRDSGALVPLPLAVTAPVG